MEENTVQNKMKKFQCKDYRALVVDDVAINRSVAGAMIAGYGIEVDEADSGRTAIALIKEHKYDMIFMDHMMPEMDGVETAQSILAHFGESEDAPVLIALTAHSVQDVRELYENNGIRDVISKPFEEMELHQILDKWIPDSRKLYIENEEEEPVVSDLDLIRLFMLEIDVVSSVRMQGSIEAYLELVDLFYTDGMRRKDLLKELIDKQDIENYVIEVHGLKSAAANIGAARLSELAKKHEESGKASDLTYIKENRKTLFDAYETVLNEIKRVLGQQGYGQFAGKKTDDLAQIEEQDVIERIKGILDSLEAFESKEAAQKVDELLDYAVPDEVRATLDKVQVMLKMYEDDEAEDTLRELLENL